MTVKDQIIKNTILIVGKPEIFDYLQTLPLELLCHLEIIVEKQRRQPLTLMPEFKKFTELLNRRFEIPKDMSGKTIVKEKGKSFVKKNTSKFIP